MPTDIRLLTNTDTDAAGRLGREAFGLPDDPAETLRSVELPGRRTWGSFVDGQLAAKVVDRHFDSWFGGVAVPTAGIAGVAVAAEHRGGGLLGPVFTAALEDARARGVLLSGLFPTQPGIYRRLGYELVATFDQVAVPTLALAEAPRTEGISLRRGGPADADAVLAVYETWASAQNGPLTRRGVSFPEPAADLQSPTTSVTIAERDGTVVGYASWERGQHYGDKAVLTVTGLHALDVDARSALLRALGSFASAVPTTQLATSGNDLPRLLLRTADWRTVDIHPYMIRVLHVAGLLSAMRYPAGMVTQVDFSLAGDFLTANNGHYRLTVADGRGRCEHVDAGTGPSFTPQGLAVLVAGAQSCANARFAGLITGPQHVDDQLSALFGSRRCHIQNYY